VERGALWALDLAAVAPPEAREDVRLGPADLPDAAALAAAMAVPEDEVLGRLARGCRVIAAWQGDEIASYCWISTQREHVGELARDFVLPPGESYVWDCATVPAHRGRGLYTVLLRETARALAASGQRRIWIGASSTNRASNRTFANVGFRPAVSVVALRVAGRGLLLRVREAPDADEALVDAARAVVTGRPVA
jgi:ribosomal protein S18 acetylase RimI-like enzyme